MSAQSQAKRTTTASLRGQKAAGERIACLTAYDASFAAALDGVGVDVVLVGDSLGMVIQGHETTVPVTLDDMIYHTRCVARACARALVMADMPFMSYATTEQALANAARLFQEGGAQAVKLEGGAEQVRTVSEFARHGIPVCAHLGLTPQSIHKLGGYKVQGREAAAAEAMVRDALALEEAGADMLLLECVPASLAAEITAKARIPVIGIGAGARCDGQILVLQDILGLTPRPPRFAHNFLQEGGSIQGAVEAYVRAVKTGGFPTDAQAFH